MAVVPLLSSLARTRASFAKIRTRRVSREIVGKPLPSLPRLPQRWCRISYIGAIAIPWGGLGHAGFGGCFSQTAMRAGGRRDERNHRAARRRRLAGTAAASIDQPRGKLWPMTETRRRPPAWRLSRKSKARGHPPCRWARAAMIREWAKWRAAHIEAEPLCRDCARVGRRLAQTVDHIEPIHEAPRAAPRPNQFPVALLALPQRQDAQKNGSQGGVSKNSRLAPGTGPPSEFFMRPKFAFFFGACDPVPADLSAARLAQKRDGKGHGARTQTHAGYNVEAARVLPGNSACQALG